jgi:hypothetical protein
LDYLDGDSSRYSKDGKNNITIRSDRGLLDKTGTSFADRRRNKKKKSRKTKQNAQDESVSMFSVSDG